MDELYLDNIDEYVNDHNKIVSELFFCRVDAGEPEPTWADVHQRVGSCWFAFTKLPI